jgi:hypothetical protein
MEALALIKDLVVLLALVFILLLYRDEIECFVFDVVAATKALFKPGFDFSLPKPPPAEKPKEDWGTNRLYWKVGDELVRGGFIYSDTPKFILKAWSADSLIYTASDDPDTNLIWQGWADNRSAGERQRKKEREELEKKVSAESVYEMAKAAEFQKQQGL